MGSWMLGDPYTSLIACGAFVIVVSVIGVAGALTKSLEVLFWLALEAKPSPSSAQTKHASSNPLAILG